MGPRRLPVEVRRPDPEEHGCDRSAALVEHPQADPPDEDGRARPEGDDDRPDRRVCQAERRDERRGEERLLAAAVPLSREEDRERPVQDAPRHQPDHRLVGVEGTLRQEEGPHAQAHAGGGAGERECEQAAARDAHRARPRASTT